MRKFFLFFIAGLVLLTACDNYGDKVQINPKSEVYYKEGVSEAEAKNLGDFLLKKEYFNATDERSAQLTKVNGEYVVKFVIDEEKLNQDKDNVLSGFKVWHMWIQDNVFNGAKTKLVLTDDQFKDVQQVGELSAEEKTEINQQQNNYGNKVLINAKSEVYYKEGVSEAEAKKLGDFLLKKEYFNTTEERSTQLMKENDVYVVKFVINEEKLNQDKDNVLLGFKVWHMWIQDNVFNGAKTKLLLTDDQFKDVQQVGELTAEEKTEINKQK